MFGASSGLVVWHPLKVVATAGVARHYTEQLEVASAFSSLKNRTDQYKVCWASLPASARSFVLCWHVLHHAAGTPSLPLAA
jgi:hypothetical protein